MILILDDDRYGSPLSIDIKKVSEILHLTSRWRFNDMKVTKNWIFAKIIDCFSSFRQKSLEYAVFMGNYFTNCERMTIIGLKYTGGFKSTAPIFFGLGSKTNIARWQPPPSTPKCLTAYLTPKVGWYFFSLFSVKWPEKIISQLAAVIWWQN